MPDMQQTLIAAAGGDLRKQCRRADRRGISDDVVKIGVLTDMSGQFSPRVRAKARSRPSRWRLRISAARCLVSRSRSSVADHQNKPDIAVDDGAQVVRRRKGRHDREFDKCAVALSYQDKYKGQGTHRHHQRLGARPV